MAISYVTVVFDNQDGELDGIGPDELAITMEDGRRYSPIALNPDFKSNDSGSSLGVGATFELPRRLNQEDWIAYLSEDILELHQFSHVGFQASDDFPPGMEEFRVSRPLSPR